MEKTKVIFYKEEQGNNEVVAFFPEQVLENGKIVGYAHLGQHFESDLEYYFAQTELATEEEYISLLKELQFIYDNELVVMSKK